MKDKSYRAFPLGQEAGHYLRAKRKRLTESSYRDYESCLDKLARYFADLEIGDLEPPVGTQRLEEFLEAQWGARAGRTYNKNLSILRDFFKFQVLPREPARRPDARRSSGHARRGRVPDDVHAPTRSRAIVASQDELRDRVAVRLLLDYGLRKGALQGDPVQALRPPPQAADGVHEGREGPRAPDPAPGVLVRPRAADPGVRGASRTHYLMPRQTTRPRALRERQGGRVRIHRWPDQPMGDHGLHNWWYALPRAGRGRRAGHDQRRADAQGAAHRRPARPRRDRQPEGDPEAARARLDLRRPATSTPTGTSTSSRRRCEAVLEGENCESFPAPYRESPCKSRFMEAAGIEPASAVAPNRASTSVVRA